MFSRSAEIYDAVYAFKDYAAEAETVYGVISVHRSLLSVAIRSVRL